MTAVAAVQRARSLHQSLSSGNMPAAEKAAIAREIAGLLFHAEVNGLVSNHARIIFLRLKTHAHLLAAVPPPPDHGTKIVWSDYEKLEALLS